MPTKNTRVTVILDPDQSAQLDTYRRATGQSRSACLRSLLLGALQAGIPYEQAVAHETERKAKQAAKALAAQERELVKEHRASSIAKRIAAHAVAEKEIQEASSAVAVAEKARDTLAGKLAKGLTSPEDLEDFAAAQARVSDALSVRVRKLQKVLSKPKLFTPRSREPERLRRMLVSDQAKLASLANTR